MAQNTGSLFREFAQKKGGLAKIRLNIGGGTEEITSVSDPDPHYTEEGCPDPDGGCGKEPKRSKTYKNKTDT